MLDKAETEADFGKTQEIKNLLVEIDRTGKGPASIVGRPGEFLRRLYEVWYENGGLEGGKPRNSIRRMRNEWLKGKAAVPSLHPKLTGQIKLNRAEAAALVELFLTRWEYVGNRRDVSNVSPEGYIQFPTSDIGALTKKLVGILLGDKEGSDSESLLLPDQSIGRIVHEAETESVSNIYQDIILPADTIITMSRQKTVLGPGPEDTLRLFWHFINNIYNFDRENEVENRNFIWMISLGDRYIEDQRSVAEQLNVGFLFLLLRTFVSFYSERDQAEDVGSSIAKKLWIPETTQRRERSQWLHENVAIVAQNLNKETYRDLYPEESEFLDKVRLKDTDITPEHIFPSVIPNAWSKPLRSIYRKALPALDQATLSVYLGGEGQRGNQRPVRYAAHSAISEYPSLDKGNLDDVLWQFESLELPSPGGSYDDAARIVRSAVTHRLRRKGNLDVTDESIALAYLHKLGYQVLSLDDFFRVFST